MCFHFPAVPTDNNAHRLTGTLAPELGALSRLRFLHLAGNQGLHGVLPGAAWARMGLVDLNLAGGSLTGTLPPEWAAWKWILKM